jgi:hypothetical protein
VGEGWEEASVMSSEPFHVIRKYLHRGSRGKDGRRPLKYIPISAIDDEYLDELISYMEKNNHKETIDYKFYLEEKKFRSGEIS